MSREDVATIHFALMEYYDALEKTLNEPHLAGNNVWEDTAFCRDAQAKVAKVLFAIHEDHSADEKSYYKGWLDV
jgi:hypothetical protein